MQDDSITLWVRQLREGDEQAAQHLWDAYFRRLVGMAHQRLMRRPGLARDEEDIALSAFKSFCRGLREGQFADLADRDDLWKLLVTITLHKALHLLRDESRQKRGGSWRRVLGNSAESDGDLLDRLLAGGPSPEIAAQVAEEADRLLAKLESPELVELAVLKMEGYSNAEIAARWQKAERTVERKLNLVRKIWLQESPGEA